MITVTKIIPSFPAYEDILHYTPEYSLFFDIETTGLSAATSFLYLIGAICRMEDGTWRLHQWLAQKPAEETDVLSAFLEFSATYETLVHFNGTGFDLPYLAKKCKFLGLQDTLSSRTSLDLYRCFRSLKTFLQMDHMNQTALQSYLGQERKDTLDGKALIPVYQKYVSGMMPELSEPLLLHNAEDLIGMTQILPIAAYLEMLNGDFVINHCHTESEAEDGKLCLLLSLSLHHALPKPVRFLFDGIYLLQAEGTNALLRIPMFEGQLLFFFPNYRDYYYLPEEDQAVHKSIAAFVERSHRQAAKASNCYIRKSGIFLPQPEECIAPSFRISYESDALYFEYDKHCEETPELLLPYARAILGSYKITWQDASTSFPK